jgi:hypothetical protein
MRHLQRFAPTLTHAVVLIDITNFSLTLLGDNVAALGRYVDACAEPERKARLATSMTRPDVVTCIARPYDPGYFLWEIAKHL